MSEHLHSDIVTFAVVTVYAIIGFNLVKIGSAWLANQSYGGKVGKAIGGLVTFG
jgi:hypothetical protein